MCFVALYPLVLLLLVAFDPFSCYAFFALGLYKMMDFVRCLMYNQMRLFGIQAGIDDDWKLEEDSNSSSGGIVLCHRLDDCFQTCFVKIRGKEQVHALTYSS